MHVAMPPNVFPRFLDALFLKGIIETDRDQQQDVFLVNEDRVG